MAPSIDWHRIPNSIPALSLASYVAMALWVGVPLAGIALGLGYAVLTLAVAMAFGTPPGIAKLTASFAPWLGPVGTVIFFSVTMLSAGTYGFVTRPRGQRGRVPYLPFALVWTIAFVLTGAFAHGLRG